MGAFFVLAFPTIGVACKDSFPEVERGALLPSYGKPYQLAFSGMKQGNLLISSGGLLTLDPWQRGWLS